MRCEEIMKRDLACISPQESVRIAATRMRDENVGFLPICDTSMKVIGTVTDRDLAIRVLSNGSQATSPVQDVMTREVVACRPEDDLQKAIDLMAKHRKSRIMCLDNNGRLVGVISLSDIAQRDNGARASQILQKVSEREARP